MKISFLGACRQVGRSMFEVDAGKVRLLLDSGTTTFKGERFPLPPRGKVDGAIITHAHMDHSGYLPMHYSKLRIPWFCTFPTIPLSNLLWRDAMKISRQKNEPAYLSEKLVKEANKHAIALPYGEEYEFFDGTRFSFSDAGHIPGSAQVTLRSRDSTLVYTGDFNATPTRLQNGAVPPTEGADALIIESTYALREHPPRKKIEQELCDAILEATEEGNALLPCFAIGRTLEVLQVLYSHGISSRVFIDGMGCEASSLTSDFPSAVRDFNAMSAALKDAKYVESPSQRKTIAQGKGNVIIATAGMLDGGPALTYLREMTQAGRGAVFLTGFQVQGTNGRMLVEQGRVRDNGRDLKINLPVRWLDLSAHAGKTELLDYVEKASPKKVFCVHGDEESCLSLASQLEEKGFDAHAPQAGEEFNV